MRRAEPDLRVAWHEAVHEILGHRALMMVLEHEPAVGAPTRDGRVELDLDRATAVLQRLERFHPRGDEPQRQSGTVDRQRQLRRESLGVRAKLGLRDRAVAVGIDQRQHLRKDLDPGRETKLQRDAAFLDRDRRGLEVLVHAMRECRARGRQHECGGADGGRSHRAVYFFP
jgi:hypothetical protein